MQSGRWLCIFPDIKRNKRETLPGSLFAQEGWQEAEDGSYKWKLLTEEYQGYDISFEMQDGQKTEKKKAVRRQRKVLLYWSRADAEMAAKKREEKLKKAEKSTKNNAYGIVHGKDRYIKEETILKETGEVLDERQTAKVSAVDREKAEKDALYDGYFAIITSEMDYDAAKIREVYHGLWRIEESFQTMKSDFDARPIYLNKREHIRAHFLICFVALVILRLIQNRMGIERLSVDRIAEALRSANCLLERGGYVRLLDVGGKIRYEEIPDRKSGKLVPSLKFSSEDQVALDYRRIQETFGTNFYYAYAKQEDFKRFFKEMELGQKSITQETPYKRFVFRLCRDHPDFLHPYTASGFKAVGTLFNSLFGFDYHVSMIAGAAIIIGYTVLGGFLAVSTTDLIQSVVMSIALIIIVFFGIHVAGAGMP